MGEFDDPVLDEPINDTQDVDSSSDSFPDPTIDDEPEAEQSESASQERGSSDLPAELPPPPPSEDGGFTPRPTYQQDYQPTPAPPPAPAPAPAPQPEIQFYTREQLQAGVDNMQISQQQMDNQIDIQNREMAAREAVSRLKAETHQQSISKDLGQYNNLVPGWDQVGTAAFKRANPYYEKLVKERGYPDNDNTRLLALEQAFGPIERIKEAQNTRTRTAASRDTVQEVGRRGTPPSTRKSKDPLDILSIEDKKHYKSLIDRKVEGYEDWNAVRKEVRDSAKQTSNPGLRERHAELLK